jgi:hypothetical protein
MVRLYPNAATIALPSGRILGFNLSRAADGSVRIDPKSRHRTDHTCQITLVEKCRGLIAAALRNANQRDLLGV